MKMSSFMTIVHLIRQASLTLNKVRPLRRTLDIGVVNSQRHSQTQKDLQVLSIQCNILNTRNPSSGVLKISVGKSNAVRAISFGKLQQIWAVI